MHALQHTEKSSSRARAERVLLPPACDKKWVCRGPTSSWGDTGKRHARPKHRPIKVYSINARGAKPPYVYVTCPASSGSVDKTICGCGRGVIDDGVTSDEIGPGQTIKRETDFQPTRLGRARKLDSPW